MSPHSKVNALPSDTASLTGPLARRWVRAKELANAQECPSEWWEMGSGPDLH